MLFPIYNLMYNPFVKDALSKVGYFEGRDFKAMLAKLAFLLDLGGLGLFTSPPGMGKTLCLQRFGEQMAAANAGTMVYIPLSTVSVRDFYREICLSLGLSSVGGKPTLFKNIQDYMIYAYKEKRCPVTLAIDEAHHLSHNILSDLKILMNQDFDSKNYFTLILVGEPALNRTLSNPYFEALYQRITVHYNFQGLSKDEVKQYVNHKLAAAGASSDILNPEAFSILNLESRGNPRMIDKIMMYALGIGSQMQAPNITAEMIRSAAGQIRLG